MNEKNEMKNLIMGYIDTEECEYMCDDMKEILWSKLKEVE